jgi:hypothetical protein
VVLPPGWPRLWTNPAATGSAETAITIGIVLVACLAACVGGVSTVTMTSTLRVTSSAASGRETISLTVCVSVLDADGLSLDPSEVSKPLSERVNLSCDGRVGFACQQANPARRSGLLRPRHKRPRCRRAAEQGNEPAPSHYSITSSARPSSVSGTVMPSTLAVLRLRISSTFVACCTGSSEGFSPLRIRPV